MQKMQCLSMFVSYLYIILYLLKLYILNMKIY